MKRKLGIIFLLIDFILWYSGVFDNDTAFMFSVIGVIMLFLKDEESAPRTAEIISEVMPDNSYDADTDSGSDGDSD